VFDNIKRIMAKEESNNFQNSYRKLEYLGKDACCLSGGATVPPLP